MNIVDVIFIGGQSNPDGRGSSPVNPLAEADGTLTGLQMFNPIADAFQNWKIGTNNGSDTNNSNQWDPFGYGLKKYRDWLGVDNLYCVKVTFGGVSMHPAASLTGSFYWDTTQVVGTKQMYNMLLSKVEAVRAVLADQGKQARFKAVLWHQGEGDFHASYSGFFHDIMVEFMKKTRQILWNPALPWIDGTIPHGTTYYSSVVEAAKDAIAGADLNYHLVNLDAGTTYDGAHFDSTTKMFFGDATFDILKTI